MMVYCTMRTVSYNARAARSRAKQMIEWTDCCSLARRHHVHNVSLLHTSKCARLFILSGPKNVLFGILCSQAILYVAWEFRNHHSSSSILHYTHALNQISSSVERMPMCSMRACVCVPVCEWKSKSEQMNEMNECAKLMIEYMIAALKSFNCCLLILAKVNVVMMMCWFSGV